MGEILQGKEAAIRALESLSSENGKFARYSMRRALRAAAKQLQSLILSLIPSESGITRRHVKVRAAPRSRKGQGMLVGVFGFSGQKFFPGWANYGHRTRQARGAYKRAGEKGSHGYTTDGIEWTDGVIAQKDKAMDTISKTIIEEIESLNWKQ